MTPKRNFSRLFWSSLGSNLALVQMSADNRVDSLRWLGDSASAPERADKREAIARALEAGTIWTFRMMNADEPNDIQPIIIRMLVPLLESKLAEETDPTFRRLVGFLAALKNQGMGVRHYSHVLEDGTEIQADLTEEEMEKIVLQALRAAIGTRTAEGLRLSATKAFSAVNRELPERGRTAQLLFDVPLVHLLFAEDQDVATAVGAHLQPHINIVDPPLSIDLEALRERLTSDWGSRLIGLREFALRYLESTSFLTKRDPVEGFRRLIEMGKPEFDSFLGIGAVAGVGKESPGEIVAGLTNIPHATKQSFLLLVEGYSGIRTVGEQLENEVLRTGGQRAAVSRLAEEVLLSANPVVSILSLCLLMFVGLKNEANVIGSEWSNRSSFETWIRTMTALYVCTDPAASQEGELEIPREVIDREVSRRRVYAQTLRLSMWTAASEQHAAGRENGVAAWLVRGMVLADRLLPVFVEETGWNSEEIISRLEQVDMEHAVAVQPEFYPDAFDPFIYGPGEYDHIVASLLTVLLESWTELRTSEQALPIWWSPQIERALRAIARRSETEAEARVRLDREQKKPNRLRVIVSRTPQELSREILLRLSPELGG